MDLRNSQAMKLKVRTMNNKSINLRVDLLKLLIIIAISFALVSIIVFAVSEEPLVAIHAFFIGPFATFRRIGNLIETMTPLIFAALAVTVIFRSGLFSLIAEGAFYMGTVGAMIIALTMNMSAIVHPIVIILFGGMLGLIAASIPALLKLFWNVNELVTSIMLNYICLFVGIYLLNFHFRDTATTAFHSYTFPETASLPVIIYGTRVHIGTIIALILCVLVWLFLYRSKLGFRLRVTGDNQRFAKYVGISTATVMFLSQLIAGAIAGAGGAVEVIGMHTRFRFDSLPGFGWTGIVVFLLARSHPLFIPIAALFMAYLDVGAHIMARSSDVSADMVFIIRAVMMLLIAAEALLGRLRQRMIVKASDEEERLSRAAEQAGGGASNG